MHTLGLLWEWSHTFGGSPIRAEFARTSSNTRLKALAFGQQVGALQPGWYGDGRIYVEALEDGENPHLRVSVFERDPRPRMRELCATSTLTARVQYRIEMTTAHHAAAALALAVNAGIPGAMTCYPTALGYEVYCKDDRDPALVPMLLDVERACQRIPGFIGVRLDERHVGDGTYITAVVVCPHPGRQT